MPRPPSRLSPAVTGSALAVVALAGIVFGAWMHWSILDPRNIGWLLLGGDRGQAAIGLDAYLRAGTWPTLHEPLLDAPQGLPLLFTDSIPLLGLALGPFAGWLPRGIQLIGPWLFLCVVLQAGFAWALLRPHAREAPVAWVGAALLTAFPALINRFGHASLCAQWLVLWALWVFVDPVRARRPAAWAPVVLTAALIHSYLLLMVGFVWAAACLRLVVTRHVDRRVLAGTLAVAVAAVATMIWQGALGGGVESTGTYGAFPLALDAWWNPQNPGFAALVPSSPDDHGRGFEGLQYLGAGLLMLVAIAAVALSRRPQDRVAVRRLLWLIPVMTIVAVVAIGPQPTWRGVVLTTVRLPHGLIDALDPVRAAGRLMWPATYAIAYAAIVVAMRQRAALLLLGGALALQMLDLAPMFAAIRATSAAADRGTPMPRTRDPRWSTVIGAARLIDIEPPRPFVDLQAMQEVTWRAVGACLPVTFTYAARDPLAVRRRLAADAAAFARGAIDPTRLYVLLDHVVPAPLRGRALVLDGIPVIAPTVRSSPAVGCR